MAYCTNCGTDLAAGVRYCASCGTAVSPEMSSASADLPPAAYYGVPGAIQTPGAGMMSSFLDGFASVTTIGIIERQAFGETQLPGSKLTSWAIVLAAVLRGIVCFVLLPVQFLLTIAWAILALVTLRVSVLITSLVFAVPWFLLLALLALFSWLWIRFKLLRGILMLPGVLLVTLANQYLLFVPDEEEGRMAKSEFVESWPLTWPVVRQYFWQNSNQAGGPDGGPGEGGPSGPPDLIEALTSYCTNCGTDLASGVRYCASCGTAVSPEVFSSSGETSADPAIPLQVAKSLVTRGLTHNEQRNYAAAIADFTLVVERYSADIDPAIRVLVARARVDRGIAHSWQDDDAAAIADYTLVVESYSADADPAMREQVAKALYKRGDVHSDQGDHAAAIADFTLVVERYSADADREIREWVVESLYGRGRTHHEKDDFAAAIADYTSIVESYSADADPAIRQQVAKAREQLAELAD